MNNNCPHCGCENYKESIRLKYRSLALAFLNKAQNRGYCFSEANEFYITRDFRVGIKVGQYSHSCHMASSDYIVLFTEKDFNKGSFYITEMNVGLLEKNNST